MLKKYIKNGQLRVLASVILLNKKETLKSNHFQTLIMEFRLCLINFWQTDDLRGLHGFRKCQSNEDLNEMTQLFTIKLHNSYNFKTISSKMLSSSFMNYRR